MPEINEKNIMDNGRETIFTFLAVLLPDVNIILNSVSAVQLTL